MGKKFYISLILWCIANHIVNAMEAPAFVIGMIFGSTYLYAWTRGGDA